MCVCVSVHAIVSDFVTPWTVYSPLGSSAHRIFQARILEWVSISSSRGSSPPRNWTHASCDSCIGRWVLYHYCHQIKQSLLGNSVCGHVCAHKIFLSKIYSEVKSLSCVRLLATPWIAAYKTPPPMGFSKQEYWSGVTLPSPESYLTRILMTWISRFIV